jgi:hypothetical protein
MVLLRQHNGGSLGEVLNVADNCPASPNGQRSNWNIHVASFDYGDRGFVDHAFYGYVDGSVTDANAAQAAWSDASGDGVREGDFVNGGGATFEETDGSSGSEVIAAGFVWVPKGKNVVYRIDYVKCDGTRVKDPAVYVQSS